MRSSAVIVHVVGTRPNLMKVAPVLRALERREEFRSLLVHTGQHYDARMSGAFFDDLRMPAPDVNLEVGPGTHAEQTARVMTALEPYLLRTEPDLVLVPGDVNSSLAAALTAAKLQIPVAHLEAGLRSFDRRMPEELNRILTDQLSELCLTPSADADDNLLREGIAADRIHFVGNVMIDSLLWHLPRAREIASYESLGLARGEYVLVTLHRPSNVDGGAELGEILAALDEIAERLPVIFPVHPRTAARIAQFGLGTSRVRTIDPLGYLEMLSWMEGARVVVTDSGGIQEETTVLGIPCITLRDSTERPITITEGTNRLVRSRSRAEILAAFEEACGRDREGCRPDLWDGAAADRVADVLSAWNRGETSPWPGKSAAEGSDGRVLGGAIR